MELPSPVASVVPSLVLNAVVTLGTGSVSQQRSRLREYPFARLGPSSSTTRRRSMAAGKRKKDSQGKQAVLPVMRADAAGIDIGATEIFVAVPPDRATENVRSFP